MPATSHEGEGQSPLPSSSVSPSTSSSFCCFFTNSTAPITTTGMIAPWPRTSPHPHAHSTGPDDRLADEVEHVLQQTESTIRSLHTSVDEVHQRLDAVQGLVQKEMDRPPLIIRQAQPRTDSGDGPQRIWLTIGIPTIPRKGVDYLTPTLETLVNELPSDDSDPLFGNIRVIVMNNKPGKHEIFSHLQQRLREPDDHFGRKGQRYLELIDNPGTVADPAPDSVDPDDLNNPTDRPGREVRRQTCDLVTLIEHAAPMSRYFMFMEDDFTTCLNAIRILQYALTKVNTVPELRNWVALRVSYGMNGVLLRTPDVLNFSLYLRNNTVRLPPDLLWLEWFQGKHEAAEHVHGRFLAVYKYNLFQHIGTVSSFTVRPDRPRWPVCFDPMNRAWSLHMRERFSMRCRRSDLTPCPESSAQEEWTKHPMEWPMEGGVMTGSREAAKRANLQGLQTGGQGGGGQGDGHQQHQGTQQQGTQQDASQDNPQTA